MLLPQKPREYDYFFMKNLMSVTNEKELREIIELLDREDEDIRLHEREKILNPIDSSSISFILSIQSPFNNFAIPGYS